MTFSKPINPGGVKEPTLSMVLCTHKRTDLFKQALKSLVDQDAPKDRYEIIVVDNDLHPNLDVKEISLKESTNANIRYIFEPNLGLSNARNTGGKASSADYFGYFDDDAKAPSEYISNILRVIEELRPDIFGGPYYSFYMSDKPVWFKDEYGSGICLGKSRFLTEKDEHLAGANIIFKNGLLDETGWFDPSLSMRGTRVWFGSETMVQKLAWARKKNLSVFFSHDIYIYHLVLEKKMNLLFRLKSAYAMGNSCAHLWEASPGKKKTLEMILILFKLILKTILDSFFFIIHRNKELYPFWQNYVYEVIGVRFQKIGHQTRILSDVLKS